VAATPAGRGRTWGVSLRQAAAGSAPRRPAAPGLPRPQACRASAGLPWRSAGLPHRAWPRRACRVASVRRRVRAAPACHAGVPLWSVEPGLATPGVPGRFCPPPGPPRRPAVPACHSHLPHRACRAFRLAAPACHFVCRAVRPRRAGHGAPVCRGPALCRKVYGSSPWLCDAKLRLLYGI